MVKVINPVPHPSVAKRKICYSCGVELEYVPAEVKQDYYTDYTGSKDFYRYIQCPNCNKKVEL